MSSSGSCTCSTSGLSLRREFVDLHGAEEPGLAAALRQGREDDSGVVAPRLGAGDHVHDLVAGLGERAALALVDARVVGLVDHAEVQDAGHAVASFQRRDDVVGAGAPRTVRERLVDEAPVDLVVAARDALVEAVVVPEQAHRAAAAQGAAQHRGGGELGVLRRQPAVVRLLQGAVHHGERQLDEVERALLGEAVRPERERAAAAEALVLGEREGRVVGEPGLLQHRQRLVVQGAEVVVADAGDGAAGTSGEVVPVLLEVARETSGRRRCRAARPRGPRRRRAVSACGMRRW